MEKDQPKKPQTRSFKVRKISLDLSPRHRRPEHDERRLHLPHLHLEAVGLGNDEAAPPEACPDFVQTVRQPDLRVRIVAPGNGAHGQLEPSNPDEPAAAQRRPASGALPIGPKSGATF